MVLRPAFPLCPAGGAAVVRRPLHVPLFQTQVAARVRQLQDEHRVGRARQPAAEVRQYRSAQRLGRPHHGGGGGVHRGHHGEG